MVATDRSGRCSVTARGTIPTGRLLVSFRLPLVPHFFALLVWLARFRK